jgi:hypothetical protein
VGDWDFLKIKLLGVLAVIAAKVIPVLLKFNAIPTFLE